MATPNKPNTTGNRNENTERNPATDASHAQGSTQQTGKPDERLNKPQAGAQGQAQTPNQGGYGQERPSTSNTTRQPGSADQGDLNEEDTSTERSRSTDAENDRRTESDRRNESGRNDR